ncbi:hypothetical protein KSC_108970 [Ktedonobacter sp. SOSP1-52]|uniref:hypothetical protein n=1 Tax=Ktedonobacter sp. SOSP1-52 TaxID=2778366 RepID=UPI0019159B3F|nr:hypothetical protein [Ktedonobacter sp. SOSP1-52]GHO72005.1 hypothetical protein KSC_108970 [Ktedonobacter sp. SOSP1-52]
MRQLVGFLSYAEANFGIQKRMSDFAFAKSRTWPEVQQVHQTWWKHYNQEDHFAHHKRQDGRHSPHAVLRGVLGRTYPDSVLQNVLYATQFTRYLDQRGFARFKKWHFFGEDGLAGEQVSIWMYDGMLKVEHRATTLAEYAIRTTPDHKQIEEVRRSRRIETHFRSSQLRLWQTDEHDWILALRQPERQKHPKRYGPADIVQLHFPEMEEIAAI